MQPSVGSFAQQGAQVQLPGDAPRSGSYAPEAHSQKELGNAVGTAIGKPRVGSRTMMSPQQAAADEQRTQQVRVMPRQTLSGTLAEPWDQACFYENETQAATVQSMQSLGRGAPCMHVTP